jgi:autotransporter-associated beta strand protein
MFTKRLGTSVAIIGLSVSLIAVSKTTPAAVLTWTSAASGSAVDGSGNWGTASTWWNSAGNVAWQSGNNDIAVFGAAAGSSAYTVTLSGSQTIGGLTFQAQAYTLAGSNGLLGLSGSTAFFTVNADGGTIAAVIAGSAGMTKTGSGMLTFAATNTYSGPTTVNGGTLQLNVANGSLGALASPTVTVNSGGLLALNAADVLGYTSSRAGLVINGGTVSNITPASRVTLQNVVTMTGGLLTGTGTGDYGGAYSFNSANAVIATSDSGGNSAVINAHISAQNNDLSFNVTRGSALPPSDLVISSAIVPFNGRTYGIVKTGGGVLNLTASNNFTGPTTVTSGTLQLGDGGTTGSLSPSSSISNTAMLVFDRANTVAQGSDFGLIDGSGTLVQIGAGILILNAANTYTGPTIVTGGTLSTGNLADAYAPSAIGRSGPDSSHLVLSGGGVLQYTGSSVAISRGFTAGTGGAGIDIASNTQLQLSGTPNLGATLTKTGGGTLQLTNYSGGTVSVGAAIIVNQGTLDFGTNYFGSAPLGDRALNIQVNPGGNLSMSAPHGLGGSNSLAFAATSWGVVSILGGTMTLAREQYISGGTTNSLGRLILQGGTINNAGLGELRATPITSWVSTLASAQPSAINVPMTAQYGPYVFDVADGPADADLLISGNLSSSSGSYGITKVNAGKLILTGSNSYATTSIGGGTLQVGTGGASGTLGAGAVTDNAILAFARSDNLTVANVISGSGSLVQLGPGTLTLTASNNFSGGIIVDAGTLILASNKAVADGSNLTVGDGSQISASPVPAAATPVPEPGTLVLVVAVALLGIEYRILRPQRQLAR